MSLIVASSDVEVSDCGSDGTLSNSLSTRTLDARSVVPEAFQQSLVTF
jgi:hypothetical protein